MKNKYWMQKRYRPECKLDLVLIDEIVLQTCVVMSISILSDDNADMSPKSTMGLAIVFNPHFTGDNP